ncbi:MAG TPA: hypothetical protein PLX89_04910 [Verrucomicrobiota bacterium]|nr:hypothetical protein [Verrucomicrobiota bacterium]
MDSLLIRHACHAADDQQKIRVIAERVRRSFYAKAFRKISDRDFEKHLPRKLWDGATVALWLFEQTKREEYALRRLPPERLTQVEAELGVAHLWTEDPPKIENEGLVGAPKSRCGRRDSEAEQCARSCDFLYLQRQQFKQEDIADALGIHRTNVTYWIQECEESARKNLEQQKAKAAPTQLRTRHG